jgi:2-amino-4-hydroxy-6-hydroxymethyldihydropteridine diphosphokinase
MVTAYLGIGSNLGNRRQNIKAAINLLQEISNLKVKKVSHLYETNPVGGPLQGRFLNGAIKIETELTPSNLLKKLKIIEKSLGRKKTVQNGPRMIDLDILLYGSKIIKIKNLEIPHPRMWERDFVLKPLREISKDISYGALKQRKQAT